LLLATPPAELQPLIDTVKSDGGAVLAAYREPLGGHALLLAALPIERVEPTPFQRDISDAHVRKLTHAMDKTKRFLDPVIAVHEEKQDNPQARYWVPNGFHRLTALKELGAKTILALLVPEREVAYQILALNIEKAHNLREKSLGVVRMYKELCDLAPETEEHYALEFEEPALVTLGFAYQERPRLSGGAYHPALRKVDGWLPGKLPKAIEERQRRSKLVLALDEAVTEAVARLKARGLTSPYLRAFVVSRINPLRFMKSVPPFDELMETMTKRARGMQADKVKNEDVVRSGGAPETAEAD
jgi:ParB family chromosome partitioning protein